MTKSGLVNPDRVQLIMQELGRMEDQIFKDRQSKEISFKARGKAMKRRKQLEQNRQPKWVPEGQFAPQVRRHLQPNVFKLNILNVTGTTL